MPSPCYLQILPVPCTELWPLLTMGHLGSRSMHPGSWPPRGVDLTYVLIYRPRQRPIPAALQNRFPPRGHLPLGTIQANRPCVRHATAQAGKAGVRLMAFLYNKGLPAQQQNSICKPHHTGLRPTLPTQWTAAARTRNVCKLRLLGPSYYSLRFSITQ